MVELLSTSAVANTAGLYGGAVSVDLSARAVRPNP